jgi:hypothetical protein
MRLMLFLKVMVFSSLIVAAQDDSETEEGWKLSGFFQQNLNQVNFTNWAAGGENSFSSTSKARFNADFKREVFSWENYADLTYGIIKTENNPMRKNTDKIDLFSKAGRSISPKTSISGIFNFMSQFDKGFKYPNDSVVVSRFMAPGFLTISLGLDYKPVEYLSLFVSPATGKFTFVTDNELSSKGAFGVDEGKKVNPEFGSLIRIEFNKEVFTNVRINSRIVLFNNYTDSDVSNRKNTDVDWLTGINMPINKFITASIDFHILYDHDIKIPKYETINGERVEVGLRPTTQIMQAFGIGLVYNF